jgi:hypothetical protein
MTKERSFPDAMGHPLMGGKRFSKAMRVINMIKIANDR